MAEERNELSLPHLNYMLTHIVCCSKFGTLGMANVFSNKRVNLNYFSEDYGFVASFMGKCIPVATVDAINKSIKALIHWILTSYNPAKDFFAVDGDFTLYNLLEPKLKESGWLVVNVQKEASSAVGVFLLAANLHLLLLQEIATIDPCSDRAIDSIFYTKGLNFAGFYSDYVAEQYGRLLRVRTATISSIMAKHTILRPMACAPKVCVNFAAWWDDLLTGSIDIKYTSQEFDNSQDLKDLQHQWLEFPATKQLIRKMEDSRNGYAKQAIQKLSTSFNNPEHTIAMWRQLEKSARQQEELE